MFQDNADAIWTLRQGFAADAGDADAVAGGGGGPREDESAPGEPEAGHEAAAEPLAEAEQTQQAGSGQPSKTPEKEDVLDDQRAFEEALKQLPGPESPSERSRPVNYSRTFQSLREGDVVEGTVVHIDREGVLVDVGTKSEGIIRLQELTRDLSQNPEDVVSVGERIAVYVLRPENEDGNLVLSKKRADFEVAWERVQDAHKHGKVLSAMVTDRVKGGLVVDLGIRGFVPASHVGSGKVQNLDKYIGQSIPLKVVEVDRERRKVVLSHRMAIEEERDQKRAETLTTLAEGQVRSGVVRRITDYGAFVDLGGIDGLLHISEMSWTRINHPGDVVKVGQKLQVMVLKMTLETGRVSLGMRQILPDPWQNLGDRYQVGDIIQGKISRLVPFGAFVQLEEGVEAIIPNQELSLRRVKKPEQVVSVGQDVEAKILEVRPEERRMTLSARALITEREVAAAPPPVRDGGREAPRTTVADLLGDAFAERRAELERELGRETKAKSRARKEARAKAQQLAEEEAYGDLSDDELLDLSADETVVAADATEDVDAAASGETDVAATAEAPEAPEEGDDASEEAEEGPDESAEEAPAESHD